MEVEAASTSTAGDDYKTGLNALYQGKRHLLVKDIPMAIASLSESCKLLDSAKGTFSTESGEAHFHYGKALLEQARLELGVIEGTPNKEADVDDEDEEENDENEEPKEDQEDDDVADPEAEGTGSTEDQDDAQPSSSTGVSGEVEETTDEVEGDDEPGTLELAWEVLEVAKLAYSRKVQDSNLSQDEFENVKKRLAEVHLLLGEVATESEQYTQAISDYKTALDILESLSTRNLRDISQCLFQLGLAFSYEKKFDDAVEVYKKSKDLIVEKIQQLESDIKNGRTKKELGIETEDAFYSEANEIEELKALLPELDEKIQDTLDSKAEEGHKQEEERKEQNGSVPNGVTLANGNNEVAPTPKPAASGAVHDISHLVKRKAKTEDTKMDTTDGNSGSGKRKSDDAEVGEGEPPGKKTCLDGSVAGNVCSINETANGGAAEGEKMEGAEVPAQ